MPRPTRASPTPSVNTGIRRSERFEGGLGAGPVSGHRQLRGRALGDRGVRLGYRLDPLVRLLGGLLLCCRFSTRGLHRARGGRRAGGVGRAAPGPPPPAPPRESESLGAGASGGPDGSGAAGRPGPAGPAGPEEGDADGADGRSGGLGAAFVAAEPWAVRGRPSPGARGLAGAGRTGWWAARSGASRRRPPAGRRWRSARRGARPRPRAHRPRAHRPRAHRGPRSPQLAAGCLMRATASERRHVCSRDGLTRLPFESEPLPVSRSQPEALISPIPASRP